MNEMSASRKAALWVGAVFLLGAALGAVIGYSYEHHLVSAASSPLPEPARRAHRVEQLTHAQIDQVRQKGRDQIRAILRPEQKPKFEEFLKNLDQERKHNGSK